MKKLMTVVSVAATLLAFGAVYGDGLTSTGFEDNPPYVAGELLSTTNDDAGKVAGEPGFAATWVDTELEDGVATVTAYGGEGAAVAADVAAATGVATADLGSNYLKLDGAPLISRYAQAGGTAVDIGDGLYIDTLVQFTAADPETPPTPDVGGGDKLCIWLADNEEDSTQCTLMVTAGFVDSDDGYTIVATNYETTTKLANNSWHRLQVKVLAGIDSEDTDMLGDGFVVIIDGSNTVATTTCPINSEFISEYALNARAQRYMTAGSYKLFPSLINKDTNSGTITSLSFQGSGAVDNIAFTQGADIDPIEVTIPTAKLGLVADGTLQTGVTYDEDLEGVAFELDGDAPAQINADEYTTTFKLFVGYAWVGGSTEDYDVDWSIAAGGDDSGFDGGDAGKTFTIDPTTKAALEAKLPKGKTLGDVADATTGMTYAQAYALGLFNEETGDIEELDVTISIGADGKVTVTLENAPTTGYLVQCKVYEKASLTAEWPSEPAATYTYGSEQAFTPGSATAGFYKVEVVISNALQQ